MGGRPGQSGWRVGAGWLVLLSVMAAVAPGARAFVGVTSQDSIEVQIADALLVVRGRVGPLTTSSLDDAAIKVEVIEVLKGPAVVGGTVPVDLVDLAVLSATVRLHESREGLFLLWRSDRHDSNGESYYSPLKGRPVGLFLFEGDRVSAWDQRGRRSDYAAHRMDGRALTDEAALMAAAREAAKVVEWEMSVTLAAANFPRTSPLRSVTTGQLRVPCDGRLERLAVSWLDEADVRYRMQAADVLLHFRSAQNARRLRVLTRDPAYELESGRPWEAAREERVKRVYPARVAAATVLAQLGLAVPEDFAARVPHGAYRPVGWGKVLIVAMGVAVLIAACGRRGGVGRRAWVGAWLAAAVGVGLAGVRNRADGGAVVSWAVGGASYELVSAGRDVWLLRVADGARAAGAAVRTELVAEDGWPWFRTMLVPAHSVGGCGLWWSDGDVAAGPKYQMVSAPWGAVVAALLLVPAWSLVRWATRKVRGRRWRRAGRCAACGYDLRGTAGGGRCPECGTGGLIRRRGFATAVMAVAAITVLIAGAAGVEAQPEPAGDWQPVREWERPWLNAVDRPSLRFSFDIPYEPPDPARVFRDAEMPPVDRSHPRARVADYDLTVADRRPSEEMALASAASADVAERMSGARALRQFPTDENERRLRWMAASHPGFEVVRQSQWEPRRDWRDYRRYVVRAAAGETLWAWHGLRAGALGEPPFVGPHSVYPAPPWGRWIVGAAGVLLVIALSARRGRGLRLRRLMVGGLAVAAGVAAVLVWRSHRVCDTLDVSGGSATYVVASAQGAVWWVRVRDGSPARAVGLHEDSLGPGDDPWFVTVLWGSGTGTSGWSRGGLGNRRGNVVEASGNVDGYRVVGVPGWAVVAALGVVPGWAVVARGWRAVRRRRRMRGDRCGVCGYDLRGSPERCPECGTPRRRRAAGRVTAGGRGVAAGARGGRGAGAHPHP